ncbi:MAG TPA: glycosyltransferase family 4 protein [Vicinamibacterales bacterium]|nr:glycosyltransferase family 4 protein [Vicinamibacterales bacterium]
MSERLRIASLTTFYPPYNFGGDGIDVQRTARVLAAMGHAVTVIHDTDTYVSLTGAEPTPALADPHVEVIALRSRTPRLSTLLTHQFGRPTLHRRRLRALDRERQFDVVLFNNVSLVGGPGLLHFGGDAARIYVAHEHWLVCESHVLWRHNREACTGRQCVRCVLAHGRPPQLWRYTGALPRALAHVDAFVARSHFSRAQHEAFGFPRPMDIVPYGVPMPEAPYGGPSPHPRPYFFFAGRLEPIKGVADLIDAFDGESGPDLVIAGAGTLDAELRAQAQGRPRVHFLGRMATEQLAPYYRHATASLVPSKGFETFGMVAIEALAQGTPVIARRIGPLPELIETTGGGATFATVAELREHIADYARDPAASRARGERGREVARARYNPERVASELVAIIDRELARKRGGRATGGGGA